MTAEEITNYLTELNDELRLMDIKGEVSLYGGAVMCLAFKARPATNDVDAIFEPVRAIRNAALKIADRHGLEIDWINMAVEIFVVDHPRTVILDLPNLKVFVPDAKYMLAMKAISLRPDSNDTKDLEFLIRHLALNRAEEVMTIVADFYPNKQIKEETRDLLEEYFSNDNRR
ncbi:MAG: hypothetical protein WBO10_10095 [Pyrinomonadaceae bacterium]